jgi:hypothetical protein
MWENCHDYDPRVEAKLDGMVAGILEAAEHARKVSEAGYWSPGMLAYVLGGGVHQLFRETVYVNKDVVPTPETKHRFKLTMSNGDSFWVDVSPILEEAK